MTEIVRLSHSPADRTHGFGREMELGAKMVPSIPGR